MRKFNVGDVVKRTGRDCLAVKTGGVYTVARVFSGVTICLEGHGLEYSEGFSSGLFELHAAPVAESTKFQRGDKVRCVRGTPLQLVEGNIYTITQYSDNGEYVGVEGVNGGNTGWDVSRFVLVETVEQQVDDAVEEHFFGNGASIARPCVNSAAVDPAQTESASAGAPVEQSFASLLAENRSIAIQLDRMFKRIARKQMFMAENFEAMHAHIAATELGKVMSQDAIIRLVMELQLA